MARPGARAGGLVLGAVLLFVVGTNVQSGWLLTLSSLLLGAVVAGSLLPGRMVRGISVERHAPAAAFQGDDVRTEVIVENRSRGARVGVEIHDEHLSAAVLFVPGVRPGERITLSRLRLAARRGTWTSESATVASAAPFGVLRRRRPVSAPVRTVVYPRVFPLSGVPMLRDPRAVDAAQHEHPRRGPGHDYLGVREYQVGDSLRHVHWPSTARHGSVMVREFQQEAARRLDIVIDAWADAGEEQRVLDAVCSVAASVALSAEETDHTVQLVVPGAAGPEVLTGPDRTAALEWLAGVGPSGVSLPGAMPAVRSRSTGADAILIVAPTWRANRGLAGAIAGLKRSQAVGVVLIDASSYQEGKGRNPPLDPTDVEEQAEEIARGGAAVCVLRRGDDPADVIAGLDGLP